MLQVLMHCPCFPLALAMMISLSVQTAALGAPASPLRQPGRTITGMLTPAAQAEEDRIAAASSKLKNTESIITIIQNEQKMVRKRAE